MRAEDAYIAKNISATTSPFVLRGGRYSVSVVASFGGGTVKLQRLSADGTTYVDLKAGFNDGTSTEVDLVVSSFSAAGNKVFDLAQGSYRLEVTTATAVYADIIRIPGE